MTAALLMAGRIAALGLELLVWSMSVEAPGASCTVTDPPVDGGRVLVAQPLSGGLYVHGMVRTSTVTFTRLDLIDVPARAVA